MFNMQDIKCKMCACVHVRMHMHLLGNAVTAGIKRSMSRRVLAFADTTWFQSAFPCSRECCDMGTAVVVVIVALEIRISSPPFF